MTRKRSSRTRPNNRIRKRRLPAFLPYLFVFAAIGLLGAVHYLHKGRAAEILANWNVTCNVDHFAPDDPIVFPGQPGASHMHSFYSNKTTDASSTAASLYASPSSCAYIQQFDHSAYWIPTMYVRNADGTVTMLNDPHQEMTVYYWKAPIGSTTGPQVRAIPIGLRMVAGDAKATSPQSTSIVEWDCGGGGPQLPAPPTNCAAGTATGLHVSLKFPSCWDGVHLDSADHKSHMAYADPTTGACPSDHPVSLPQVVFEIHSYLASSPGLFLSSGGVYSMHGDFYAAWDARFQQALIDHCLNGTLQVQCHTIVPNSNGDVTINSGQFLFNINNLPPANFQGDINNDGTVNLADMSILLSHWGTNYAAADLDNSGSVGLADLSILLSHWGT